MASLVMDEGTSQYDLILSYLILGEETEMYRWEDIDVESTEGKWND